MLSCTRGQVTEEVALTGPGEEAALDLQREEEVSVGPILQEV
jgi:hypothetical protein